MVSPIPCLMMLWYMNHVIDYGMAGREIHNL